MVPEVGFTKQQSNPILKHFNTPLGTEKTEKENLEHYGFHESVQVQERLAFHIQF